ncbi:histidine kinase [Lactiplantibacillus plantarum]|uniref:GHKL domain-containing protein n=1 Tax=Lactiplantibacillus plantarum TaxID=1590 RepID=UPI0023807B6F|nr:GHKL domain-containing protein [Lactiplantibacillus plantarum]MDE4426345.1 histidine kinase [Lactiplantibacillus plantarum]MDE4442157.1 histidine kinase [Lactiplantibacillus plantarum]
MLIIFLQEFFLFVITKAILKKRSIQLFDISFVAVSLGVTYAFYSLLQDRVSFLVVLLCIIYAYWYEHNISKSVIIAMEITMLSMVADHLASLVMLFFDSMRLYLLLFSIFQSLLIIMVYTVRLRTNCKPFFEDQKLNRTTAALLCIVYLYIILSEGWKNQANVIFSNLIILLVMIGLFVIIYNEYLNNVKSKYEVQKQRIQIQNDTRYMNEIEAHYNELRRFRHDYQNMLISIDEYLKTDDLEGLQEYYQKNLAPVSNRVLKEKYNLEDLSRVKVKSIKSILFSKLSYAQSQEIEVHFDLKEPLIDITVNELDLDIALGIMLDNAIKASVGHADGEIMSAIFIEKNSTVFLIQNNVFEQLPPLWKLKEAGYSTKGKNRGIGLNSLSKIVNRNENMILETRVLGAVFLQRLTVKRVSQND